MHSPPVHPSRSGPRASLRLRAGLACLLGMGFGSLSAVPAFQAVERVFYDLQSRLVSRFVSPSDEIVVVAITNETLRRMDKALGRFPWPRVIYAAVIDICRDAKSVGMDLLLAESEPQRDLPDTEFLRNVRACGRVVSAVHLETGGGEAGRVEIDRRFGIGANPPGLFSLNHDRMLPPYPGLLAATARIGHVNPDFDADGVMRRYPLALPCRDQVYPSLALAMHLVGEGGDARLEEGMKLRYDRACWRLSREGTIPFVQPARLYKVVEFSDLLERWREESTRDDLKTLQAEFRGRHVLIGCLATGLPRDRYATPVHPQYPGVMAHAAALDGLMNNRRFRTSPPLVSIALAGLLALLVAAPRSTSPGWKAGWSLALLFAYLALAAGTVLAFHHMLPVAAPAASLGGYAFLASMYYWRGDRRRRGELEKLEDSKQRFTDMLVHDLKGRMATMLSALSGLEDHVPEQDAAARRLLDGIQSARGRMLTQVSALLDIRRMEEGAMRIDPEPVSMNEQVGLAVREHEGAALVAGMRLEPVFSAALTRPCRLDPHILQRVFSNLLWNAILHGAPGGTIEARVLARPGGCEVVVANPGRILPASERENLFRPFQAGLASHKNAADISTGLGLAFCRLATEAMGGTIRMHSPVRGRPDGVEVVLAFPFPPPGPTPTPKQP